VTFCRV